MKELLKKVIPQFVLTKYRNVRKRRNIAQESRRLMLEEGSGVYWENRYSSGGNSGAGSYGKFAEFKAEVIKQFLSENDIESVIELGCGDGNQTALTFSDEISYLGLDISKTVIKRCIEMFKNDMHKDFMLFDSSCATNTQGFIKADVAISLDVIYHLIEDDVYEDYMRMLFGFARKYVIIYSSNKEESTTGWWRSRRFTDYVDDRFPEWQLIRHVPNPYPLSADENGSWADFFIYKSRLG